jgi:hypothetical protein
MAGRAARLRAGSLARRGIDGLADLDALVFLDELLVQPPHLARLAAFLLLATTTVLVFATGAVAAGITAAVTAAQAAVRQADRLGNFSTSLTQIFLGAHSVGQHEPE